MYDMLPWLESGRRSPPFLLLSPLISVAWSSPLWSITLSCTIGVGSTGLRSANKPCQPSVLRVRPHGLLITGVVCKAHDTELPRGSTRDRDWDWDCVCPGTRLLTFLSHTTHSRLDRLLTHRHFKLAEDTIVVRGEVTSADFSTR